jgi:glycerol kinase
VVRERTGLVLDPYFSATKIEWLLQRNPEWRARAADGQLLFGTIDSWVVYRLTGGRVHATDHTNASRTLLYSLDGRSWDPELCDLFGVPMAMLPEVRRSGGDFGVTDPGLFGAEVRIAGVAGDQQAALYGQGAWAAGAAKNTYGTGAFALLHTGERKQSPPAGILATMACTADGGPAYALEGAVLVAGSAVQWLRDGLGILTEASESEALARSVEDTGGIAFVPAFAGLGTPHWIPEARGTMVGLTRGTTRAHVVRATLEAIAHASADVVEVMAGATDGGLRALRVDGGAAQNGWMMQFQADVLQVPVLRPETSELSAIGAAGLAGVTVGFWARPEDFLPAHGGLRTFEPRDGPAREYAEASREDWRRAVDTAVFWARHGEPDGGP